MIYLQVVLSRVSSGYSSSSGTANSRLKVLFRSNDILLAMHANMYALVHLQKYVADQLGLPVGSYTHMVTVPHIYVKRDASELKKWLQ